MGNFVTDPGLPLNEAYLANTGTQGDPFSTLGMIKLSTGDKVWFTWMKQDLTKKNASGSWAASLMEPGSTYVANGGNTKVPTFDMTVGAMNDTQAQIAFSSGTLPGVNNAANFGVVAPYNSTFSIWQRSQWAGLANGVSRPSSSRLVNPTLTGTSSARPSRPPHRARLLRHRDPVPQPSTAASATAL